MKCAFFKNKCCFYFYRDVTYIGNCVFSYARGNTQNYKKVENVHQYLFFPSRNNIYVRKKDNNTKTQFILIFRIELNFYKLKYIYIPLSIYTYLLNYF